MVRLVLVLVLVLLVARVFWRIVDNIIAGASGGPDGQVPQRGVAMVRDPVCGTFVLPDRAVTLANGPERLHFCSAKCRDAYRARTA
jgi:hypothetical protein